MAEPFFLIDGYNLMHAAGMARARYGPGMLEKCRNRFITFLRNHLTDTERPRTTVIFDAKDAPPDVRRRWEVDGVSIVFAEPGGDADSLIEECLLSHSAPKLVKLVSSDHRLQKAARRRRARFVDSEVFHTQLERRGPHPEASRAAYDRRIASDPKRTGKSSDEETAAWLEVFGEIPEAAELQDEVDFWQKRIDEQMDSLDDENDNSIGNSSK